MTSRKFEVAAAGAVVAVVVVAGLLLSAWRGFPKGVDAYQHLTRLNFVADWFPHHNWFYACAAGMPMFDNYPGLPYVAALPFVKYATLHDPEDDELFHLILRDTQRDGVDRPRLRAWIDRVNALPRA